MEVDCVRLSVPFGGPVCCNNGSGAAEEVISELAYSVFDKYASEGMASGLNGCKPDCTLGQ